MAAIRLKRKQISFDDYHTSRSKYETLSTYGIYAQSQSIQRKISGVNFAGRVLPLSHAFILGGVM